VLLHLPPRQGDDIRGRDADDSPATVLDDLGVKNPLHAFAVIDDVLLGEDGELRTEAGTGADANPQGGPERVVRFVQQGRLLFRRDVGNAGLRSGSGVAADRIRRRPRPWFDHELDWFRVCPAGVGRGLPARPVRRPARP